MAGREACRRIQVSPRTCGANAGVCKPTGRSSLGRYRQIAYVRRDLCSRRLHANKAIETEVEAHLRRLYLNAPGITPANGVDRRIWPSCLEIAGSSFHF